MLRSTLLFVAGFTVVFVALGAGATAVGRTLNDHERGLNQITGVLVIVMGLFLAGVASPRLLQAERRMRVTPSRLGPYAAPVMGVAFAFGWTPCLGPVLSALLALASTSGTVAKGAALLFVYSLGLGVPFVLSGLGLARLQGTFSWIKRHYRVINAVAGRAARRLRRSPVHRRSSRQTSCASSTTTASTGSCANRLPGSGCRKRRHRALRQPEQGAG